MNFNMIKRNRPRPNMTRPKSGFFDHSDDNRLKNRNHYQQLLDKYNNLAKEALRAGDRVEAEIHSQYAEHYLRLLNERIQFENRQSKKAAHHAESERVRNTPPESETPMVENEPAKADISPEAAPDQQDSAKQPKRRAPRSFYQQKRKPSSDQSVHAE